MDVSIILCTRNRAERLAQTLRSIAQSGALDADSELLLVDNASTDRTSQVLGQVWPDLTRGRYILEPRVGQGYGYMTGVAAARGKVLLFTDDDLNAPPGWVQDMSRPILAGTADAVQGGIRITESLIQPWMQKRHRQILASSQYLNPTAPEGLIGANMAIARYIFDKIPAFDMELGCGKLGCCQESLFALQMREAGFRIKGALDSCLEHCPDPSRLDPNAWLRHAKMQGQSEAYVEYHWRHADPAPVTVRHRLGQAYWKIRRFFRFILGQYPTDAELEFWIAHIRNAELHRMKGSPRNYEKFGLVKLRGVLASEQSPG